MNANPEPATPSAACQHHARFEPEVVFDLIRPIEVIVESMVAELHGRDFRQTGERTHFILAVDRTLLVREPWSRVVPVNVREALVSRVLRTYWWSQGGVLDTSQAAG